MRWGIAGHGDVVHRRAVPALRSVGEEVVAMQGRQAERPRAAAIGFGVQRATTNFEELVAVSHVVYVATPVPLHVPLAVEAARRGRPVLIEKPVSGALTADTGPLLASDTPTAGVAYYRRLSPHLLRLQALLDLRGSIPPLSILSRTSISAPPTRRRGGCRPAHPAAAFSRTRAATASTCSAGCSVRPPPSAPPSMRGRSSDQSAGRPSS
jgi:predicted dehydrogenase